MQNYPIGLFTAYAKSKITRQQFIAGFSVWQQINGINCTIKGTADKNGVYLTYRKITAKIENGLLIFKTDEKQTAKTRFEFCRKVDFYLNKKEIK